MKTQDFNSGNGLGRSMLRHGLGVLLCLLLALPGYVAWQAMAQEKLLQQLLPGGGNAAEVKLRIQPESAKKALQEPADTAIEALQRQDSERADDSSVQDNGGINWQRRAREYEATLVKLLRAEGYYAGQVRRDVNEGGDKPVLSFTLEAGEPYTLRRVEISSEIPGIKLLSAQALGLKEGRRFRAETVLEAEEQLRQYVQDKTCLWQTQIEHSASVFHESKQVDLALRLRSSPAAQFGAILIEGTETVANSYVREQLTFAEGECFSRDAMEKTRLKLLKSGLFSGVEITPTLSNDGTVPVTLAVTERLHRTIKLGGGFNTDEGPILSGGWEHRNFLGAGQTLKTNAKISTLIRSAQATLELPQFYRDDQTLLLSSELAQEELDAFDALRLKISAVVERALTEQTKATAGLSYQLSEITDANTNDTETFALASVPLGLSHDARDSLLDPTKGWLASVGVEPFVDTLEMQTGFVKASVRGSVYHTVDVRYQPTLALRGATGSISGVPTTGVPADQRFYVGGAGSVRGYPYQSLGPLDGDDPLGGRSFVELSAETRLKFNEDWGGVVFMDGGNAFDEAYPSFNEDIRWAAGVGMRYYTSFAPIRVDIGVPLDKRDGVDDNFQFYISIGQAF